MLNIKKILLPVDSPIISLDVIQQAATQTKADLLVTGCYPYGTHLQTHGYAIICAVPIPATIEKMERNGINQLPVVERGRLVGVFSRDDLVHYLGILQSLRA